MKREGSPPPQEHSARPAIRTGSRPLKDGGAPSRRFGLFLAWPISVCAHVILFAVLLGLHGGPAPPPAGPSPIVATVVELPAPERPGPPEPPGPLAPSAPLEPAAAAAPIEPAAPAQSPPAAEAAADAPQNPVPPASPEATPPRGEPPSAVVASAPDTSDVLSESQLQGATSVAGEAGSGGGGGGGGSGGGCDTARVVQRALQRDPLVRKAVADAQRSGKAIMVWNGDWVRSGAQDGKGLSGVREAIMWEVAFAPEACRNKRENGLVLLSLSDGTRFAIGADTWRWSDLLGVPQIPMGR